MAELFKTISYIAYTIAGIFLIISLFLFFKFNIRKIFGDLSGRNAKKSIRDMQSKKADNKKILQNVVSNASVNENLLQDVNSGENNEEMTTVLDDVSTTDIIGKTTATAVLGEKTATLVNNEAETVILSSDELQNQKFIINNKLIIEQEILYLHTKENIN